MSPVSRRIHLHVGLPKTGTTTLQEVLWHNRTALAAAGLLYPGRDSTAHHRAAVDLMRERYRGWLEPGMAGAWRLLVEQLAAWPRDAVVSSELFAPSEPDAVAEVLSALDFAEVHVICTVRDIARQIPSVWQEDVKNQRTLTFGEFLTHLRPGRRTDVGELFWSYQDLPAVLANWPVPAERVHVVTVPPRGSAENLLWQRFATVLGVDPDGFDTKTSRRNASLGVAETELLRRLNEALADTIDWPHYVRIVKDQLAEDILPRRAGGTALALPAADRAWAAEVGREFAAQVARAGYHVAGDLRDLVPADEPAADAAAAGGGDAADGDVGDGDVGDGDVADGDVADVAVAALAEIMRRAARADPSDRSARRLRRLLLDLSEQHPRVMAARRVYWRTRAKFHQATAYRRR